MAILTTIPRELRDQILSYVVYSYQNTPPALDQTFEELTEGREVLRDVKLGSWCNTVLNDPQTVGANATNLLLTNHQIHAETLDLIKHPSTRIYELDVIIADEIIPVLTWLRVPVLSTNLDKITANFRISGSYDRSKDNRRGTKDGHVAAQKPYSPYSRYKGFRGGCGAGPAMSWQIYSILERFIKAGPVGRTGPNKEYEYVPGKDWYAEGLLHRHVVVKTIAINVETPPDVDPALFATPRSGGYASNETSKESVLDPRYLADFIKRDIMGLLQGGNHEWFSYGKILYEHVDMVTISVDGEELEAFDVAQRLKSVGGFQERYLTAGALAEYKRLTWEKRRERGLKVLEE
jgi:hypothetical protein